MAQFIDQARVKFKAGNGGNGIISFRHEKFVNKGGPNGGNGGDGGNIILRGDNNIQTLINFKYKKNFIAENGKNGGGNNKTGAKGKDLILAIPLGTKISLSNKVICDITFHNQEFIIAKGGKGGRGNASFKTLKNSAPQIAENGTKGEEHLYDLEINVMADVGFVGIPSVGKSTLLSNLTSAKPKIADYEFTTLIPQLGICYLPDSSNSFVIADLPGLIAKASKGKGLGIQFLKHIQRCKVIAHILDGSKTIEAMILDYKMIRKELEDFSSKLKTKLELIIINKSDLISDASKINQLKKILKKEIIVVSALTKDNLSSLTYALDKLLKKVKTKVEVSKTSVYIKYENVKKPIVVNRIKENEFEVLGDEIDYWLEKISLHTHDNFLRFINKMISLGVYDKLNLLGVKNNDIIYLGKIKYEMEYIE